MVIIVVEARPACEGTGIRVHHLEKQIPLQLGTVGTCASINSDMRTMVAFTVKEESRYCFENVSYPLELDLLGRAAE